MPTSDTDSQGPIFWERLRRVFKTDEGRRSEEDPERGVVIAVCLLISTVLWLALTLEEQKTVTLDVPTAIEQVPTEKALTRLPPSTVRVDLQGQGLQLLRLYVNRPTLQIEADESVVDVKERLVLPEGADVQIVNVRPQSIDLSTEPRIERRLPIRSRVSVGLPTSYEIVEGVRLEPDSVTISGAKSLVEGFSAWPTDSTHIDGLRDSVAVTVPLSDTLQHLIDRSTTQVTARVKAGRFAEAMREIEVEVTGVPANQNLVALEPSTIRVEYRVLFDQLFESQRSSDFFATVSYDQIRSDTTGYVTPRVQVPSDLLIRDPEPVTSQLRYYTFVSGD